MPEFILDHGSIEATKEFNKLDLFTQSYIEAMYWTECNSDNPELDEASLDELSPDSLKAIIEDCTEFQESNAELLEQAYGHETAKYDDACAGHDFWLTRNGHGCGFWDRGLGNVGDELTKNSKPYGSQSLYRGDDGLLYLG